MTQTGPDRPRPVMVTWRNDVGDDDYGFVPGALVERLQEAGIALGMNTRRLPHDQWPWPSREEHTMYDAWQQEVYEGSTIMGFRQWLREQPGEDRPEEAEVKPARISRGALVNLLHLVWSDIPGQINEDDVHRWSRDECDAVQAWATAVHLRASDNDDVVVPPVPHVLQ